MKRISVQSLVKNFKQPEYIVLQTLRNNWIGLEARNSFIQSQDQDRALEVMINNFSNG